MNLRMTEALAHRHVLDLRRDAALRIDTAERAAPCPTRGQRHSPRPRLAAGQPRLRNRLGFTLVEAGLRLLAGEANASR
jgi:hypothetical protein